MSGLAVLFNLDGRPVEAQSLTGLLEGARYRGPDYIGEWTRDNIGLGCAMLRTTPESRDEKQPATDEEAGLALVFDGRIDNREELVRLVEFRGPACTDAELVLAAYKRFGTGAFVKLLGDFALVIWDATSRRMICARDIAGMRPLYYFHDGRRFVAGSTLRQIIDHPGIPHDPNEQLIAVYLTGSLIDAEETVYRNVRRVLPGHYLVVTVGRFAQERFFDLDSATEIRYRNDAEYGEHFRSIFDESVRCRLRSSSGVAVELSGGLDSSSIVSVLGYWIESGKLERNSIDVFSMVSSEPELDERRYAEDVINKWRMRWTCVPVAQLNLRTFEEQANRFKDFPEYPNGSSFNDLKSAVVRSGHRVLLTGLGGDQWLQGTESYYADLIREGRWIGLLHRLRHEHRFGVPGSPGHCPFRILLRQAIWPLMPKFMRTAVRRRRRRAGLPPALDPRLVERTNLIERLAAEPPARPRDTYAQGELRRMLEDPWMIHVLEIEDRAAACFRLEERHPFYDRRIIEFAFAIPEDQRFRQDLSKVVLRAAMNGILPESICQRRTKADFTGAIARMFKSIRADELLQSTVLSAPGWINGERLHAMYTERVGSYERSNLWPLCTALTTELWYRDLLASMKRNDLDVA